MSLIANRSIDRRLPTSAHDPRWSPKLKSFHAFDPALIGHVRRVRCPATLEQQQQDHSNALLLLRLPLHRLADPSRSSRSGAKETAYGHNGPVSQLSLPPHWAGWLKGELEIEPELAANVDAEARFAPGLQVVRVAEGAKEVGMCVLVQEDFALTAGPWHPVALSAEFVRACPGPAFTQA